MCLFIELCLKCDQGKVARCETVNKGSDVRFSVAFSITRPSSDFNSFDNSASACLQLCRPVFDT